MPTRKKTTGAKKASSRRSTGKGAARASVPTGPVPPYGEAIRAAVARGDVQEMKRVATNARKWVDDVSSALEKLESSLKSLPS